MRTVLITGATGFVGSALAANFLARSMRVIVNVDDVLQTEHADSLGHPALAEVTEVWHCAAEMSYTPRSLPTSFKTNVGITSGKSSLRGG